MYLKKKERKKEKEKRCAIESFHGEVLKIRAKPWKDACARSVKVDDIFVIYAAGDIWKGSTLRGACASHVHASYRLDT